MGKIAVRDEVLLKPGKLTPQEFEIMKTHAAAGAAIVAETGMHGIARIVRHHHERCDGRGYPDGLSGSAIPLLSRILVAADSLDAMTTDRSYRPSRTTDEATAVVPGAVLPTEAPLNTA